MDWIFDNFQLLFVVGAAIAAWLSARKKKQEEEQEAQRRGEEPETSFDTEDQVRRVQEEIRRKIQQRLGIPEDEPAPRYEQEPTAMPRPSFEPQPVPPPLPRRAAYVPDEEEVERQRRLQSALREVEERRRVSRELSAQVFSTAATDPDHIAKPVAAAVSLVPRLALHEELRDPQALRRAIILREVLGPPLGLR